MAGEKGNRGGQYGGLYGRTPAQDKAIKAIAKRTANLKNEQLRIVDGDGKVLIEKRGETNAVHFTVGEGREYGDGNVFIHNHPEGGTFSAPDLKSFGYGAKEIVAAAPEGTYRLIRTSKGTPDWVKLRDRVEAVPEVSPLDLRKQARANLEKHPAKKAMDAINKRFGEIRETQGKEAANQYARDTKERHDTLMNEYKRAVDAESRRLETKPFDDIYRKFAKQYGLKYIFEPKRKK